MSMTSEGEDPERKTYKLQPICADVRPQKLVDVTIYHPLGYHHEPILSHRHAQQRQHVWMTEAVPSYDLPAESLHKTRSVRRYRQ